MFNSSLTRYKLYKSINKLIVIFCLFILSGCGGSIGTAGSGEVSGYDSGEVSGYDSGEVIGGASGEVSGNDSGEVIGGDSGDNSEANPVDFVKLSWMSPMSKADGSALTNLGGYQIYYRKTDDITQVYSLDVGNVTSATIHNLSQGTWCFAISAYNEANIESDLSNYACKDI